MTKKTIEENKSMFKYDLVTKVLFLVSATLLGVNIVTIFAIPEGATDYDDGLGNVTTRTLELQVLVDIDETFIENLNNEGYYFTLHVKGDQYVDMISYPFGILLEEGDIVKIPLVNNGTNFDDGEQDIRMDIWVNHYDDKFKTVNFKEGSLSEKIDITDIAEYVIADMNEEADEEHE